jgi:hypothetical protein
VEQFEVLRRAHLPLDGGMLTVFAITRVCGRMKLPPLAPLGQAFVVHLAAGLLVLGGPLLAAEPTPSEGQAAQGPLFLEPATLARLRQMASTQTPQWKELKKRLDDNLNFVMPARGAYQASDLAWISDYALAYVVLKPSDKGTAERYADKAVGLMISGLHDFKKGTHDARQFLSRGDGTTKAFPLPHQHIVPPSLRAYLAPVIEKAVVKGAAGGQDDVEHNWAFLKVSNRKDGPADYREGSDWRHNGHYPNNQIDWSAKGKEPATGATYYVTGAPPNKGKAEPAKLEGNQVVFGTAPAADQAVFVEYIYGTHASDYSSLAYQQTTGGGGGFNSILIDSGYTARFLGKHMAMGLDWLDDYPGLSAALKGEIADLLIEWSDYTRDKGFMINSPSNYGAGKYVSRMLTAAVLLRRHHAQGERLLQEIVKWRQQHLVPVLTEPTTSLKGGFYPEGGYGALATKNILLAAFAYEALGQGKASAERDWCNEVIEQLVEGQPTKATTYDGGEWYAYPAPIPGKDLFYFLAAACTSSDHRKYANYIIQNYSKPQTGTWEDVLYRDPSAPAAFWGSLPLYYHATGTGLVTARADWSYESTWCALQLGNIVPGFAHQRESQGHLRIQRGGDDLLVSAVTALGTTLAHSNSGLANTVILDDNGEKKQVYRFGPGVWYGSPGVVTQAFEATKDHVYVSGDHHTTYSTQAQPGDGGSATELNRQFIYLRPDYIVVYDRAATLKDSYPKQLRWHFLKEPTVKGDAFIATSGASKLFGQTFSTVPLNTTTQPVTVGKAKVHQIITHNSEPAKSVRYVTAFQVAPSSTTAMVATQHIVSTDSRMEGVQMADQVVLFGRNGDVKPDAPITYQVQGSGSLHHLLVNLKPGTSYQVKANGSVVTKATASAQGALSFSTSTSGETACTVAQGD